MEYLRSGNRLTQREAVAEIDQNICLGGVVSVLRKKGHRIESRYLKRPTPWNKANKIAEYWMPLPEKPE